MFKIYDLNMKELPFPEGVKPLDIFVSSVNKRRLTEEFEGRSGTLNYGYDYGERSVDLSLWLEAYDTIDYRLIRNELYAFFDTHDVFYIEETRVPSRVLKVTIDESYIPERINQTHSLVEISCRTLDSVFWESKYTTLELHDSGYSATAEKYGLVDNIDDEKVKYRFEPENQWNPNLIPFNADRWEDGSRWSSGSPTSNSNGIRMKDSLPINVQPGREYTLYDESLASSNIDLWRVFEVNPDDTLTQRTFLGSNSGSRTFVVNSDKLLLAADHSENSNIEKTFLNDGKIKVKLEEGDSFTGFSPKAEHFTVYNAGNVKIEPESMDLYMQMNYATSDGNLKITNKTTGETFEYYRSISRRHITLNGMVMTEGGTNRFRNSNRRFISLAPGDNEFEITGATFDVIYFRFKYLYK